MCFFISLLPATIWVVVGYVVYYLAGKSEGTAQKFGKILSYWIFTIAAFFPIMGAYVTLSGLCPFEKLMGA